MQTNAKNSLPKPIEALAAQVETASKDIQNGGPKDVQAGKILADESPGTIYAVNEYQGKKDQISQSEALTKAFYADPTLIDNPEKRQAFIAAERKKLADQYTGTGNAAYLTGRLQAFDDFGQKLLASKRAEDVQGYNAMAEQAYRDSFNASQDKAMGGSYQTASDTGTDTSVLKGLVIKGAGASLNPDESIGHLKPAFATALTNAVNAMPPELRAKFGIESAYRDGQYQEGIMLDHMTPEQKGKWQEYKTQAGRRSPEGFRSRS